MNLDNKSKFSYVDRTSEQAIDLRQTPVGSLVKVTYGDVIFPAFLIDKDNQKSLELMPLNKEKFLRAQRSIDHDRNNNSNVADLLNVIREYTGNGMLKKYSLSEIEYKNWREFIENNTHGKLQKYLLTFIDRAKLLEEENKKKLSYPTKIIKLNNKTTEQTDTVVLDREDVCNFLLQRLDEEESGEITQNKDCTILLGDKISNTKNNAINLIKSDKETKKANRIKQKNYINQVIKQLNEKGVQGNEEKLETWKFFFKKKEEDVSIELKKQKVIKLPEDHKSEEDIEWTKYKTPFLNDSLKADIYQQAKKEAESDLEKENTQNYYFINRAQEVLNYFNNSKVIKIFFDEEFRSVEQACLRLTNLNWETQQTQINYAKRQIIKLSWVRDFDKELKIVFEGKGMAELSNKSNQAIASFLQPLMSGKYSCEEATNQWGLVKFKIFEKIRKIEYHEKKNKLINDRDFEVRVIEQTAEVKKELVNLEYDRKLNEIKKEEPKKTSWWQKAVAGVKNIFRR